MVPLLGITLMVCVVVAVVVVGRQKPCCDCACCSGLCCVFVCFVPAITLWLGVFVFPVVSGRNLIFICGVV